jgi:hypothetical protein
MVGHEAESKNLAVQRLFPFCQIIQVIAVVIITGKDRLMIVATVNDVVRVVGHDDTG